MTRTIIIFGLIAGAIMAVVGLITMPLYDSGTINFDNGEIIGYTTMTIAFVTIFFGIKSYRDKQLNGVISFWKALKMGLLIYLVAAVIYAVGWEVMYSRIGTEFVVKMTEHKLEKMKAKGATDAEIEETRAEWKKFGEMYENPLIRFPITMSEPAPVGIILSLVSAALLRRKEFLPAMEEANIKGQVS